MLGQYLTSPRPCPPSLQVDDGEGNENNEIEVKSAVSDTGSQESLDDWETLEIPAEDRGGR